MSCVFSCCLLGIYVIVSIIIALIVMATGATLMVFGYAGPSQMQAALCDDDNDFGKWWSAAEKTVLDECETHQHTRAGVFSPVRACVCVCVCVCVWV